MATHSRSCLENPRDGEAWWAAVYGVAQSRTRLQRLSSSSRASLEAQRVRNQLAVREIWVPSLGQEDPLEKGLVTHSSIPAWRIPWTEVPGGLQFLGSFRVLYCKLQRCLLLFRCSVMPDSLRPHGQQHPRLLCPSPSPRACSNSRPLCQRCHPTSLVLCRPLLLLPSIFLSIRVFSNESF